MTDPCLTIEILVINMLTLRNKFDVLYDISEMLTPNDEYENLPTKLRAKHRILWEILAVKKKCDDIKTTSLYNKRNLINANVQKLKKAQSELTNAYLKEQTE